ncbi:XRE family transcriptional regulator [Streptomyces sp. CHD11]|uniref:ATP-binding protein n=1 Tax=Streptomyces sp. CHD11 TaxID=2741325 RepID=UPI001BFC9C16|nr:helix-turn-helix domain-containing protein [Streptomyces sp. CHD11]MBT3153776.1 XRE family transcriptional regulator [Streptomyces sp. CHD11]
MVIHAGFFSFGRMDVHQLREFLVNQRRVSGWTQEELAERSGVSVRTIRNLETGSNTNPRRSSVELLLNALGGAPAAPAGPTVWDTGDGSLVPAQRTRSEQDGAELAPWHGPRPLGDPLVGRETDMRHILASAQRSRLMVLTGPGGVGKTRLALAAAYRLRPLFPDGVAVAELRDCAPEHLEPVRSRTELDALTGNLTGDLGGTGRRLLVLDGAERVVRQTARLARRLLDEHPGLHLLVTSRRALAAGAAESWEVEPLRVGRPEDHGAGMPSAVELLLRRVRSSLPTLDLAPHLPQVTILCRLLDGMPLAIEIAAQRLRSLPLSTLLREETLFPLLDQVDAGALSTHRTLSESVRWSYDLLPAPHRDLLHDLVTLPDPFALDDVLAGHRGSVGSAPQLSHRLAELVDASLVQTLRQGQYRYRVHALVRHVVARARSQSAAPAGQGVEEYRALTVSAAGAAHSAA